jgi:hypothetical protein
MKSRSIRMALLSAFVLGSPLLTFAASQRPIHVPSKDEIQDRTGITRAVQQGKGGGMSRNQVVLRANAYRLQTPEESQAIRDKSDATLPKGDSAFRK